MIKLNTTPVSPVDYDAFTGPVAIILENVGGLEYYENSTGREIKINVSLRNKGVLASKRFTATAAVRIAAYINTAGGAFPNVNAARIHQGTYDFVQEASPQNTYFTLKDILLPAGDFLIVTLLSDNANDTDITIDEVSVYDASPGAISYSASNFPQVDVVSVANATPLSEPIECDMVKISSNTSAASNLEATYDGTGYNNAFAPATQGDIDSVPKYTFETTVVSWDSSTNSIVFSQGVEFGLNAFKDISVEITDNTDSHKELRGVISSTAWGGGLVIITLDAAPSFDPDLGDLLKFLPDYNNSTTTIPPGLR